MSSISTEQRLLLGCLVFLVFITWYLVYYEPAVTTTKPAIKVWEGKERLNKEPLKPHCTTAKRVHLQEVTALLFAMNHTVCLDRTAALRPAGGGERQHSVYQLQPNSDAVTRWVQCTQQGWDGSHSHWRCEAQPTNPLVNVIGFDDMFIYCEGWDAPGDAYILSESCYLHYTLRQAPAMSSPLIVGFAVGWVR